MTDLITAAQQALEALELGYDAAKSEADQYHAAMAGFRPERHAQMDAEVQQIAAAITALRAALAQEQEMPSNTRYTVAVEGQALTYWDNIHDAVTNAQRAVYADVDATTRAIDDLRAGRLAEWSYGFSAVRIYPPQKRAALAQQQPNPPGCDHCNHPLYAATRCRVCGRVTEQAEPVEPVAWLWKIKAVDEGPHTQQLYFFPGDDKPWSNGWTWTPLYTAPPQRKPLTDEEIAAEWQKASECASKSEGAVTTSQFVQMFARAVERAHGIKE